jgi:hypothetical protein
MSVFGFISFVGLPMFLCPFQIGSDLLAAMPGRSLMVIISNLTYAMDFSDHIHLSDSPPGKSLLLVRDINPIV